MSTMNGKQDEFGNNFITLTDDAGQEIELEHLDTLEYDGETYMAFIPAEMSVEEEYELMILKVEADEDAQEEILVTVDDEDVLNTVFEKFSERLENYYEEEAENEEEALRKKGY